MNKTFSPNIKKKIKIKGLNQEVSLNQFKKIKALDKKKLITERDNYKSQIKALEKRRRYVFTCCYGSDNAALSF